MLSSGDIKAIFFDLDDTILDIEERKVEAALRLMQLRSIKASRRLIKNLFNSGKNWLEVLKLLGIPIKEDVAQYVNFFIEAHNLSKLQPGARKAIKTLENRFKLFIVTSRENPAQVEKELEELGVRRFFCHIVTREQAAEHFGLTRLPLQPFSHQRRLLYQCALEFSDLSPKQVIVVGDHPRELLPAKMVWCQ